MTGTGSIRTTRSGRVWWWVAAGALLLLIVCIGIIVAGAMNDSDGSPLVENPGAVLVGFLALVSTLGSAVVAKFSPSLSVIKENVQNDHTKPDGSPLLLRDDLDGKHDATIARQDALEASVTAQLSAMQETVLAAFAEVKRDIGGLRSENRDDRDDANRRLGALDQRITHIEQKGTTP